MNMIKASWCLLPLLALAWGDKCSAPGEHCEIVDPQCCDDLPCKLTPHGGRCIPFNGTCIGLYESCDVKDKLCCHCTRCIRMVLGEMCLDDWEGPCLGRGNPAAEMIMETAAEVLEMMRGVQLNL